MTRDLLGKIGLIGRYTTPWLHIFTMPNSIASAGDDHAQNTHLQTLTDEGAYGARGTAETLHPQQHKQNIYCKVRLLIQIFFFLRQSALSLNNFPYGALGTCNISFVRYYSLEEHGSNQ